MAATAYKFASPVAASMKLVAISVGDNAWQIKFHESKMPYCTHTHSLDELKNHDASGKSACPKCVSVCAHRFAYKAPTKNGVCFFCRLAHSSGEKRVKLAKKCASMAVGQGWWDFLLPYDYESHAPEEDIPEEDPRPKMSLSMLPNDMFFEIVKYLDLTSIEKLSAVEKDTKTRLMESNYGLVVMLNKHVEYTFPLVNRRYVETHAPYLTTEGVSKILPDKYKNQAAMFEGRTISQAKYKYVIKNTNGAVIPRYRKYRGSDYDAFIVKPWIAFVYNCRNPHKLFQFMIEYRKHKEEELKQTGQKLWTIAAELFKEAARLYSFSETLLTATLDDARLEYTPLIDKYGRSFDETRYILYQYCESREMLPHTTDDYRSLADAFGNCEAFYYGIKDVIVLSEATKILINVKPGVPGYSPSPVSRIVLPYISNRWDDNPPYYALFITLVVSLLYESHMKKGEYKYIQNFLKRMELLDSPDVVDYIDILKSVKYK